MPGKPSCGACRCLPAAGPCCWLFQNSALSLLLFCTQSHLPPIAHLCCQGDQETRRPNRCLLNRCSIHFFKCLLNMDFVLWITGMQSLPLRRLETSKQAKSRKCSQCDQLTSHWAAAWRRKSHLRKGKGNGMALGVPGLPNTLGHAVFTVL